jgi:hypothetical protein
LEVIPEKLSNQHQSGALILMEMTNMDLMDYLVGVGIPVESRDMLENMHIGGPIKKTGLNMLGIFIYSMIIIIYLEIILAGNQRAFQLGVSKGNYGFVEINLKQIA